MIEILDDKKAPVEEQKVKITEQVIETKFSGTLKDLQAELEILFNQKAVVDKAIQTTQELISQIQKELEKLPPRDLREEYPKEPVEALPEEIIQK